MVLLQGLRDTRILAVTENSGIGRFPWAWAAGPGQNFSLKIGAEDLKLEI